MAVGALQRGEFMTQGKHANSKGAESSRLDSWLSWSRRNWRYLAGIGALVLLLAASGIYFSHTPSVSISGSQEVVLKPAARIVFNGQANEITAGQNNTVVQGNTDENPTVIVRSNHTNARPTGTTEGAFVQLTPDIVRDLAGKRILITVWARAGAQRPSTLFAIACSSVQGSSGWVVYSPTAMMKPYSFTYQLPANATPNPLAYYIGIWSDVAGAGGALEVRLISVEPWIAPAKK